MSNKIKKFRDPLLDTSGDVVGCYEREFFVFSNFSSFQVRWSGRLWPTSEHAYQAAHFFETAPQLVEDIYNATSAHRAFKIAKSNGDKAREDWEDVKVDIMEDICRHKLQQHPYVYEKLNLTEDVLIVEDSPVDSFWGWGSDRKGRNELGKVWMRLRDEIRTGVI